MRTAAVILNYNDPKATMDAVRRISGFGCIDNIVVVDNASTDDSRELIGGFLDGLNHRETDTEREDDIYHRYMLVLSDRNGGYGYGNNIGVRYAYEMLESKLCLIANPDSVFGEELIKRMQDCFEDEDVAVAGAVMNTGGICSSEKDTDNVWHQPASAAFMLSAWPLRGYVGELLNSGPVLKKLFRSRLNYPPEHFSRGDSAEVDCVHGSLLMVDCERFLAAGGYDEGIFLYCEETVLGSRMKKNGFRTVLTLGTGYLHGGGGSIKHSGMGAVKRQLCRQRSERYYYRNYLGVGRFGMLPALLLQKIVLLETGIYELCMKLRGRSVN